MKIKKLFRYLLLLLMLSHLSCKKEMMEVATGNVSGITPTTAYVSGYIMSAGEGIKKYGHCFSRNTDPTILDNKTEFGSTIGVGEFTSFLYGLDPGVTYYTRAYISSGNMTVYGEEIRFTTEK